MDGFGVLRALAPNRLPMVVFTTAYDEYALRAFEVHALDYLLKPFDSPRFLRTLERARERLERQRAGDLGKRPARDGAGPPARARASAGSARGEVRRPHLLRAH
jgi:two-component system LytT family response regulator